MSIHYENLFVYRNNFTLIRKFVNDFKDKWGDNEVSGYRTFLKAITERYTGEALEVLNKDPWVVDMHPERDFYLDSIDTIFRRNRSIGFGIEGPTCYNYSNYLEEYHRYLSSDYVLKDILKDRVFNVKVFRELDDNSIIIHMLEVSGLELPLYLNSGDGWVTFIANWRLRHGT